MFKWDAGGKILPGVKIEKAGQERGTCLGGDPKKGVGGLSEWDRNQNL